MASEDKRRETFRLLPRNQPESASKVASRCPKTGLAVPQSAADLPQICRVLVATSQPSYWDIFFEEKLRFV